MESWRLDEREFPLKKLFVRGYWSVAVTLGVIFFFFVISLFFFEFFVFFVCFFFVFLFSPRDRFNLPSDDGVCLKKNE